MEDHLMQPTRNHQSNGNGNQAVRERGTELRDSPMMAHLLDALEAGTDIGHYGRLTFAMVARHFLDEEELVALLARQPDQDETKARSLVLQVRERDYNPPKRERILDWQARQEFPICPDADDPAACNVYRELQFPDGIYDQIEEFYEEQAEVRPAA
jgi:hypothetical protein